MAEYDDAGRDDELEALFADRSSSSRGLAPPLAVPNRLAAAMDAAFGQPAAHGGEADSAEAFNGPKRLAAVAAARAAPCFCGPNTGDGQARRALSKFIEDMRHGVSMSLLLDGVGVLLVNARLNVCGPPVLLLQFNGVERRVPLETVEQVIVERAHKDSGAWLVRLLLLDQTPTWTFLFDGTAAGHDEASYVGGCLRMLTEDLAGEFVQTEARKVFAPSSLRPICTDGSQSGKPESELAPRCTTRGRQVLGMAPP